MLNNTILATIGYVQDALSVRAPATLPTIKASVPADLRDQVERALVRLQLEGRIVRDARGRYLLLPDDTTQTGLFPPPAA